MFVFVQSWSALKQVSTAAIYRRTARNVRSIALLARSPLVKRVALVLLHRWVGAPYFLLSSFSTPSSSQEAKCITYLLYSLIHNSRSFWMLILVNHVLSFPITLHYEIDISAIENA